MTHQCISIKRPDELQTHCKLENFLSKDLHLPHASDVKVLVSHSVPLCDIQHTRPCVPQIWKENLHSHSSWSGPSLKRRRNTCGRVCSGLPRHLQEAAFHTERPHWALATILFEPVPEKFRFLSSQPWTFAIALVVHQTRHLCAFVDVHKDKALCVSDLEEILVFTCPDLPSHQNAATFFTSFPPLLVQPSIWTASYRLTDPALGLLPNFCVQSHWSPLFGLPIAAFCSALSPGVLLQPLLLLWLYWVVSVRALLWPWCVRRLFHIVTNSSAMTKTSDSLFELSL